MLEKMKAKVQEKDQNSSRTFLDSFITSASSCGLFEDFAEFRSDKGKESVTFFIGILSFRW